jgi:hypothetical protein
MRYRGGLPVVSSGVVPLIALFKSLKSVLLDRGRAAIVRDYADVPPAMGMMKGKADTQLQVRVRVTPSEAGAPPDEEFCGRRRVVPIS